MNEKGMERVSGIEKKAEMNFADLSADEIIRLLDRLEAAQNPKGENESDEDDKESEEGSGKKKIPSLTKDGTFDRELFAAVMMYESPQYALFSEKTAPKVIGFLKELNEQLQNHTLTETIEYLESQIPYLNAAREASTEVMKKVQEVYDKAPSIDWFKNLGEKADANLLAARGTLARTQIEILFTTLVNRTYDALWNEYLIPKPENGKSVTQ